MHDLQDTRQALYVTIGDPAGVGADDPGGERGVVGVLDLVPPATAGRVVSGRRPASCLRCPVCG